MKLKMFLLSAGVGLALAASTQTVQHDSIHVKIMKIENGVITDIDTSVAKAQHDELILWLETQGIEMPPPPMPGDSMHPFVIERMIEIDSLPPGTEFKRVPAPPRPPAPPLPPGARETIIMRMPAPPPGHEGEVRVIVCDSMKRKECHQVIIVDKARGNSKRPTQPEGRTADNEMVIYPNPSTGQITLEINMPGKGKTDLTITDMNGKTVYTEQLPESDGKIIKQIDLSKNGKGMYSVRLSKGGKVIVEQVVIE